MKRNARGFSIVEIMIVMAIAAILLVKGSQYFQGDMQTTDLNTTRELIVNHIQRARMSAQTRGAFTGVKFASQTITIFDDADKDGVFDGGEANLGDLKFRGDVKLMENCGTNSVNSTSNGYVIFNTTGFAGYVSSGVFVKKDWQVFIFHTLMDVGNRAREVEILASGLVEKTPQGSAGYVSANARQANANNLDCSP